MNKIREHVPYAEAVIRIRTWWSHRRHPKFPCRPWEFAAVVWPDHDMSRQGAGFSMTGILKRMQSEGLAYCSFANNDGNYWSIK